MEVHSGVGGQGDGERCSSGGTKRGNSSELSEVNETGLPPIDGLQMEVIASEARGGGCECHVKKPSGPVLASRGLVRDIMMGKDVAYEAHYPGSLIAALVQFTLD